MRVKIGSVGGEMANLLIINRLLTMTTLHCIVGDSHEQLFIIQSGGWIVLFTPSLSIKILSSLIFQ